MKQERFDMPDFFLATLIEHNVLTAYKKRPDTQQNEYVGWIMGAKQDSTRDKRIEQMVEELTAGDKFMGEDYKVS